MEIVGNWDDWLELQSRLVLTGLNTRLRVIYELLSSPMVSDFYNSVCYFKVAIADDCDIGYKLGFGVYELLKTPVKSNQTKTRQNVVCHYELLLKYLWVISIVSGLFHIFALFE